MEFFIMQNIQTCFVQIKRKSCCQTMDLLINPRTFKHRFNNLFSFFHCKLREDQTCFKNPIKCRHTRIPWFLNCSETLIFKKFLAGITENETRVCIPYRFILYETTITPNQWLFSQKFLRSIMLVRENLGFCSFSQKFLREYLRVKSIVTLRQL